MNNNEEEYPEGETYTNISGYDWGYNYGYLLWVQGGGNRVDVVDINPDVLKRRTE